MSESIAGRTVQGPKPSVAGHRASLDRSRGQLLFSKLFYDKKLGRIGVSRMRTPSPDGV